MALEKEIWQTDIVEGLWASNPHLNLCVNSDQYVLQGKVVHIPNAGTTPAVKKNRSALPAAITRRQDIDITYALDEYTSDPILIVDAEKVELSYDKRQSVLGDTKMSLGETIGVMMIHAWAPKASRIMRTTGTLAPAHIGIGLRKKFTLADLRAVKKQFDKDNIPTDGRYIMIDPDMLDQFSDELTPTQQRDFSTVMDSKTGVIGKLLGFTFLSRSFVLAYAGLNAQEPGEELADASCAAALCWHTQSVERALGEVKFFEREGDPQYYGDVYSALVRMGGRVRRADGKGVIAIVQGFETTAWQTGKQYSAGVFVTNDSLTYICTEDHTSSAAFATDNANWTIVE